MKRTAPLRRTPLARGQSTLKRTPLKAVSEKRGKVAKLVNRGLKPVPAKTRRAVRERDGYRCRAGGCWIGETGGHIHHRKLRSQGGDHSPANLLLLCDDHHRAVHASPGLAYELGFLVRSSDDPALIDVACYGPVAA